MKHSRANDAARCPACQRKLDGATDPLGNAAAKAGDVSCCLYCGNVSMFQSDMTLRAMRAEEVEALSPRLRNELELARFITRGYQMSRALEELGRDYSIDFSKPPPQEGKP